MVKKIIFSILVCCSLQAKETVINKIVAVINEQAITDRELDDYRKTVEARKAQMEPAEYQEVMSSRKNILSAYIDEITIMNYARENSLEPTEQEFRLFIEERARNMGISVADFEKQLKYSGQNMDDFRQYYRLMQAMKGIFNNDLRKQIAISDNDVKKEFAKRYKEPVDVVEYKILHILFSNEAEAQAVKNKIIQGSKFEEMVYEYSTDEATKSQNGDLGYFQVQDLLPGLSETVTNMSVNDIKGPVKTKLGYHIIKLADIRNVQNAKYREHLNEITQELQDKEFRRQLKLWTERKRDEAYVKIYL